MDITYQYSKLRCNFGRQPLFCCQGPLLCDSIAADAALQRPYILRNPVHAAVQHGPCFAEHDVNTIRAEYCSTSINHAEGGWPRDVNTHDAEMTQRYRRKVEKEDAYIHCVQAVAPVMEKYLNQNNAIDMYHAYYSELAAVKARERVSARTVNVFREPLPPPRAVSSLAFEPEGGQRLAVAYLDVDASLAPRARLECCLWDVESPNAPAATVTPPCPLLDLQFNPRDLNVLVGGLINGQVGVWDARAGGSLQRACAPHAAHRELVRQVIFINSKSGQEFFSAGPDGEVKWWDLRAFSEPSETMLIDLVAHSLAPQSRASALGVSALEYEPTIPTRFMVGTENGLVVGGNRKGKTPMEKLPIKFPAHVGPVWTLQRNPGFLKNFLTVGDWTARVWSEDCRESAVLWSPPHRHRVTSGVWSPTRLSLMALAQWDGVLALWDLLRRQHAPVLTVQLCAEPLLRLCAHDQGSLVACGSRAGNVYMAQLSRTLAHSEPNDKALMLAVFERESRREHILESRLREIKLKLRQAEEAAAGAIGGGETVEEDPTLGDRDLIETANNFTQVVKRELANL